MSEAACRRCGETLIGGVCPGALDRTSRASIERLAHDLTASRASEAALLTTMEAYQQYVDFLIQSWNPKSEAERSEALRLWTLVEDATHSLADASSTSQGDAGKGE